MIQGFKNLSILLKISSIATVVLLLISSFVFIYFPLKQKQQVTNALENKAESTVQMLASGVSLALGEGDLDFVNQLFILARMDSAIVYLGVLDENGSQLISYNPYNVLIPSRFKAGAGTFEHSQVLHTRVPLPIEEDIQGNLIVGFSLEDRDQEITKIRWVGFLISAAIFLLGLFMSFYLSRLITSPIQRLVKSVKQIGSEGHYIDTIEKSGTDEIGTLIDAFNDMSAKIETRTMELQRSEMQMEAVLDTVGEGIVAVDESLNIVMVNQEAVNIWRCGHNELIGENLQMLINQENRDKIGNGLVPDNGHSSMLGQWLELEGLRKDGSEFPLEINISQTKIGERLLFTAAVRDITSRKQAEEHILAQERLASVGQLAAGIAHDFNNMLTVMTGFAELLRLRSDISDDVKGRLEVMIKQGNRAAQLIGQILDFSRKTVAERQPTDLDPFVKDAVKLFERTMPETIQVVTEFRRGYHIVNANKTQLQQVITNLAVNARDAMPEGGELRIGLSLLRLEPGDSVAIRSSSSSITPDVGPGNWVVLTVSDTGVGMPPEVVARIYEPFFTTKQPGKGTGLGLSQIYGIVKQHDGYIDVESEVGKGTSFTIYLPQAVEEVTHVEEQETVSRGLGETILMVEDDPEVRTVAKEMLEQLNYRVVTASNGREALEVYDTHRDQIVLVLTDVVMPDMGGLDLFEALIKKDPKVLVVVMTGYPLGEVGPIQLPEGIKGILQKPLSLNQVSKALNNVLARKQ